jgi:hypothetical protein
MKKITVALLLTIFLTSQAFALGEGVLIAAQTALQEIWEGVRESQAVQTLLQLKETYEQSKEYYAYVKKMSEFEGGIGQYYASKLSSTLNSEIERNNERLTNLKSDKPTFFVTIEEKLKYEEREVTKRIESFLKREEEEQTEREERKKMEDEYKNYMAQSKLTEQQREKAEGLKEAILIKQTEEIIKQLSEINQRERDKEKSADDRRKKIIEHYKTELKFNKNYYDREKEKIKKDSEKASEIIIYHNFSDDR